MLTRGPHGPSGDCGVAPGLHPPPRMETRAFHICPFCQAQCPVAAARCVRCRRALADLPLPVYGAELDAEMRPSVSGDLVDLPLRDTIEETPSPASAAPTAASGGRRQPLPRRRDARAARLAIVAGLMGAAGLLGAVVLVGSWLVRAEDRRTPAETVNTLPAATVPPATVAPASAAPATVPPVTAAAPPRARPASPSRTATAVSTPPPMAEPLRDDMPAPRPRRPPAAEVIHVHPDVAADPVDVERARDLDRDDLESGAAAETPDAGAQATLRARLDRAQQHRDAVAERVRELRERVNVPVIKDVDEYQRLQEQFSAALDELDQADTEVRRFRRALRRRAG